jgi:uncharacterized protein YigA (DUF484 family)
MKLNIFVALTKGISQEQAVLLLEHRLDNANQRIQTLERELQVFMSHSKQGDHFFHSQAKLEAQLPQIRTDKHNEIGGVNYGRSSTRPS